MAALLIVFLLAEWPMRRLRVFISTHFYRNKYDYRITWLRFVQTLSSGEEPDARRNAIRAVAEIFGSTSGLLMIRDQDEVLPCPWHGKTLGRLSEGKSLSEIFLGENFAALRRNMLKPEGDPDCANCPIKTLHLPVTSNS